MTYLIWNGKRYGCVLLKLPHWHGSSKRYPQMMVSSRVRSSMYSSPHIVRLPDLNRFSTCCCSATSDFTPNHYTVTPYQSSIKRVSFLLYTYGWTAIRKTGTHLTCKKSLHSHHDDCPVPKFTTKHCYASIVWPEHVKPHKYHGSMSTAILTSPSMGCVWRLPLCRQLISFKHIVSRTYPLSILPSSWREWMWNCSSVSYRIRLNTISIAISLNLTFSLVFINSVWAPLGHDVIKMRPIQFWPPLHSSMPFHFVWFLVYWLNRD